MERTRLDPANPYSVLIGNIQNLYHECIRNWSTWPLHRSGIYTEFYHKMNEFFNRDCYTNRRGGGTLHIDYDRTRTNAVQIKRLIDESHNEWFKLSEEKPSKFPKYPVISWWVRMVWSFMFFVYDLFVYLIWVSGTWWVSNVRALSAFVLIVVLTWHLHPSAFAFFNIHLKIIFFFSPLSARELEGNSCSRAQV
jgi:hypothetical protein